MTKQNNTVRGYVQIHDSLRYFLSASELSFVIRLKHLAYQRANGYKTAYSQEFNFNSFNLSKYVFYRCANRLEEFGLLERVTVGKYTDYVLVESAYDRLVEIAYATPNVLALLSFAYDEFKLKHRAIADVSDEEIVGLRERGETMELFK